MAAETQKDERRCCPTSPCSRRSRSWNERHPIRRVLITSIADALCAGLVLGCVSQSSNSSPEADAAATCSLSCLYQYQDVTVCNELGPSSQPGPWLENCVDVACGDADLVPNFGSDPYVPCTTSRQLRYVQTHLGACGTQSTGHPVYEGDDAGSEAGKGDGAECGANDECLSANCVSADGQNFVCADACNAWGCPEGFACLGGYCFPSCTHF